MSNGAGEPMDSQAQICITLQLGTLKEYINVERGRGDLIAELRERGRAMVEKHLDADKKEAVKSSPERMLLFRHDYKSANFLQVLGGPEELENGSVVEIVLTSVDRPTKPHLLEVHTYMAPTFCDYGGCGEILVGLVKQGLRCTRCRLNFHKKCAFGPHNNCSGSEATAAPAKVHSNFELPHTFEVHSYQKPTVCRHCTKLLVGLVRQGLQCRDCKANVHKKCVPYIPNDCRPSDGGVVAMPPPSSSTSSSSPPPPPLGASLSEAMEAELSISSAPLPQGDLIPLSRIPGAAAVRHRGQGPKPLLEGWLLHFTNQHKDRRLRHYWILRPEGLELYNEGLHRAYLSLPLADIHHLRPFQGAPLDPKFPPHCFEIVTANVVYYVGENLEWYAESGQGGPPAAKLPRRESGMGKASAERWYQALSEAMQPPKQPRASAESQVALDFSQLYQVNPSEELGSGQFGTVYGGVHRQTSTKVAIKVIAKDRFGKKQKEQLCSEVGILKSVSHPGIIRLEAMFETSDRIFVVMEKMEADMLEMILSNRAGRLDERVTRYLIVQILAALQYLHSRDIAHCDLKPENVLLSSPHTEFPQTKLCDFGYARFIGESQFRNTVVGTPAYLAPEVLQKKGYNKSLDQWSVGVVIYVTLSGTFPFNEGEEIAEQIQNAEFMFPSQPWDTVSPPAIDLISGLLKVERSERLSIEDCLRHQWLRGKQLVEDLADLEAKVGLQYLTNTIAPDAAN